MAKQVITSYVDDIDATPADGTVHFALDGVEYEIDLNDLHEKELREALAPFVDVARKVGAASSNGTTSRGTRSSKVTAPVEDPAGRAAIREWAREHGFDIADRGRISAEIRDAYADRDRTHATPPATEPAAPAPIADPFTPVGAIL